ncbi:MAG: PAAR domain-containing protein [Thiomicrorhabdus sp.]|jgi:uncharacterized Zn-binding protein involved in type VI secretion|nr:PAAR domain-containing protein [Thiomicrorhabdus sp.]
MPAATRLGDGSSGHSCFPPRSSTSGSGDVFINGMSAHRGGDSWETHVCGNSSHGGSASGGSATVFINGSPAVRIGDSISCGDVVAGGSSDVMIG